MLKVLYSSAYEITPLTLAVLAQHDKKGTTTSLILEENTEHTVALSPSKIIDYSCKFFGSSLKGRQEGTREVSGLTHKAPIAIDPSSGMYFLPTTSPVNLKCSWISHTHIEKIREAPEHRTELIFSNGKGIIIDVSFGSMMNQVQRTAQFRYILDNRIKNLPSYGDDHVAESYS